MVQFRMIHDIVEENGRTVRENNLDREHAIPLGTLVEIVPEDDEWAEEEYDGVRLYVVKHTRDCDGSPLYSLAPKRSETNGYMMHGGWTEKSLRPVVTETPQP